MRRGTLAASGRRGRGAAVALALALGGCSALADLDGYRFGAPADAGPVDAGAPKPAPPSGVSQTAGGADLRGDRYDLRIRFGAPPPMRRLEGRRYQLTLGGGAAATEDTR